MPAGNVDGVEVFRHLSEHRGLQASIGVTSFLVLFQLMSAFIPMITIEAAYLESPFQDIPELFRLHIAGILDLQVPSLGHNLLSRERSLGVPPS